MILKYPKLAENNGQFSQISKKSMKTEPLKLGKETPKRSFQTPTRTKHHR